MYDIAKVSSYICDKFYKVIYKRGDIEKSVIGLMLNYTSGNIVLLAEEGVYHIKYNDIIFMRPDGDIPIEKLSKEYIDVIATFVKE